MSTIRALLAISGVVICGVSVGAAGCAEPGVVQVNPTGKNVNKKDGGVKDAGKKPVSTDEDPATEDEDDDEDVAEDDVVEDDADDEMVPAKPEDAGKKDPVKQVDAGTKPVAEKDAGAAKPDKLPPCPATYTCQDPAGPLSEMGLDGEITDPDGKPVTASCAKGGQEVCDPKDPKKSCPNFTDPYCIHVKITGLLAIDFQQCGQKCDL